MNTVLDKKEKLLGKHVEVREGTCSTLRTATLEELNHYGELRKQILQARRALEYHESILRKLQSKCDHKIIFDEAGHTFDVRKCACCEEVIGLV